MFRQSLRSLITNGFHEMRGLIMSAQDDVDALTTAVTNLSSALATDVTNINSEIAALEAQIAGGQPVNLASLQAAVANLSGTVDTATAIVPPAPPAG